MSSDGVAPNPAGASEKGEAVWPSHPFDPRSGDPSSADIDPDDDKLHEECGIYGVIGVDQAARYVALGLHALQHRGQEAAGICSYDPDTTFNTVRRLGLVRDNFTKEAVFELLPGRSAIGHNRYSTHGSKGAQIRDVQPLYADFALGGCAIAHNGNLTNAEAMRARLIERGSIFQSHSDTECIVHLMARSHHGTIPERMKEALRSVEGAFSVIAMTRTKLIGVRDPSGVRPLNLGRLGSEARGEQRPGRRASRERHAGCVGESRPGSARRRRAAPAARDVPPPRVCAARAPQPTRRARARHHSRRRRAARDRCR
ncbi:MAG: hypothetical protein AAF503_14980, partial [Pseudomonadota bacterium]